MKPKHLSLNILILCFFVTFSHGMEVSEPERKQVFQISEAILSGQCFSAISVHKGQVYGLTTEAPVIGGNDEIHHISEGGVKKAASFFSSSTSLGHQFGIPCRWNYYSVENYGIHPDGVTVLKIGIRTHESLGTPILCLTASGKTTYMELPSVSLAEGAHHKKSLCFLNFSSHAIPQEEQYEGGGITYYSPLHPPLIGKWGTILMGCIETEGAYAEGLVRLQDGKVVAENALPLQSFPSWVSTETHVVCVDKISDSAANLSFFDPFSLKLMGTQEFPCEASNFSSIGHYVLGYASFSPDLWAVQLGQSEPMIFKNVLGAGGKTDMNITVKSGKVAAILDYVRIRKVGSHRVYILRLAEADLKDKASKES